MMHQTSSIRRFVDDTGLILEAAGLPRMAGQVLGWLMVCEPEHQSLADLTTALGISKASASLTTRTLMHLGLVERTVLPGDRRDYYRIAEDAWHRFFQTRMAAMQMLRRNAERGLHLLADAPPDRRVRLERMRTLFGFLEREMARLMERYVAEERGHHRTPAAESAERLAAGTVEP